MTRLLVGEVEGAPRSHPLPPATLIRLPQEAFMRRLLLSLLVLAFTLPALAQAKHPFTFEDMMKLKRVGDPQVSPDGKWVIFSVVDVDLEANTKMPHIWIVPLSGDVGTAAPGRPAERSSAGSPTAERILIA